MSDTLHQFLSLLAVFGGPTIVATGIATSLSALISSRILERQRSKYASELEKLKGEIERTIYYTKTGFDTEFSALSTIWKSLVDLQSTMTRAIVAMDIDPANANLISFQELADCMNDLDKTRTIFVLATEQNIPFYFEELYPVLAGITSRVNDVLKRIRKVALEGRDDLRKSPAAGKDEFNDFNGQVAAVADLIRKRLSHLGRVE